MAFNEFKDRAVRNPVLSLQALGAGSRLRLLARALEHLHTQAGTGLFNVLLSCTNKLHSIHLNLRLLSEHLLHFKVDTCHSERSIAISVVRADFVRVVWID